MSEGLRVLRGARRPEMSVPQASREAVQYEEKTLQLNEESFSISYAAEVQSVLEKFQLRVLKKKLDEAHQREAMLKEEVRRAREEAQKHKEESERHKEAAQEHYAESRRDALTGLANRLGFMEGLKLYMERMRELENVRLGVLFIDIDKFKTINDRYGHETGDTYLKLIAEHVGKVLRPYDAVTLARPGGDEFTANIIIRHMPGMDDEKIAEDIADRVRGAVSAAKHELLPPGSPELADSASVGMVFYDPEKNQTPEELIQQADKLMYEMKHVHHQRKEDAHEKERVPAEDDSSCDVEMPDTAVPGIVPGH